MVVLFAGLATLCAIQTFDFMENQGRYGDFARECAYYIHMTKNCSSSRKADA